LPNNTTTVVLTCPPIAGPAGSFFQFTGMVNFSCLGNSTNDAPTVIVSILEDGIFNVATSVATPGGHARLAVFDFFASIPITAWRITDGLPHVYTVIVTTDNYSNGGKQVQICSIFINNVPA
jgi:hypothetical protein